jgi:hypothetical protein
MKALAIGGAAGIGVSGVNATVNYIRNHAKNHRTRSFREEFKTMLRKHGLDYDDGMLD